MCVQAVDNSGVEVQRMFLNFLEVYSSADEGESGDEPVRDYVKALQDMKEGERTTLHVNFEHVDECAIARALSVWASCVCLAMVSVPLSVPKCPGSTRCSRRKEFRSSITASSLTCGRLCRRARQLLH